MITPPRPDVATAARERLAALATPPGALGRLGDLAVWIAACQGVVPPRELGSVRVVIFAGDHGVARHGVSAYPPEITAAMVRTIVAGRAGVSALAAAHGVAVRVLDLGVDDDLDGVPDDVRRFKVRRSSGAIHLEDALTAEETRAALDAGAAVAREEIAAGADLLISGDMGIGNTTPAAAMVAAALGLPASEVTGRGTGVDAAALAHKEQVVDQALARAGSRTDDPVETLTALASADLAASTGYLLEAARQRAPADPLDLRVRRADALDGSGNVGGEPHGGGDPLGVARRGNPGAQGLVTLRGQWGDPGSGLTSAIGDHSAAAHRAVRLA